MFALPGSRPGKSFKSLTRDVARWRALVFNGQIPFPATQNVSIDPNTLDDYEEGSWTPTIQFLGASVGMTYDTANTKGRYTKIGRQLSATCIVTLTAKGTSTGSAQIAGLPFNALNDGILTSAAIGWATGMSSVTGAVIGLLLPNTGRINLYSSSNGVAAALTNSNFSNTSAIYASVVCDVQ